MTIEQLKEAIREKTPISIKTKMLGTELTYKRALCIIPYNPGGVPVVMLEDYNGITVACAAITQIIGGDPFDINETMPAAACD